MPVMRFLRAFAVVALLLALAGAAGVMIALRWVSAPLPVTAPLDFEVPPGTSLRAVAGDLRERGALVHPERFEWYARLRGEAGGIVAGPYRVAPGDTPRTLLRRLVSGTVRTARLTLPEGLTTREMLARVQAHPDVRSTLPPDDPGALLATVGSDLPSPEGRLFPDTYVFPAGTADVTLVRQAWARMERELASAWETRAVGLPLDGPDALLVLASIVEKETGWAPDRPRVAAVLVRRLERDMRLQSDPTVIYGLGTAFDGDLRRGDLRRDSPWNTYTRRGLPPTPIAAPGAAALRAAAHPADIDALYFVARGDGRSVFSATLAEHRAAVERYQIAPARQRRREEDPRARGPEGRSRERNRSGGG